MLGLITLIVFAVLVALFVSPAAAIVFLAGTGAYIFYNFH